MHRSRTGGAWRGSEREASKEADVDLRIFLITNKAPNFYSWYFWSIIASLAALVRSPMEDEDYDNPEGEFDAPDDEFVDLGIEDAEGRMEVDLISADPGLEAELRQEMKRWATSQRPDRKQKSQTVNWKEMTDAEKLKKAEEIKGGVAKEILGKYTGQMIEWFDEELVPDFPGLESKFGFLKGPTGETGVSIEPGLPGEKKRPKPVKHFPYSSSRTLVSKKAKELSFFKTDEKGKVILDADGKPIEKTPEEIAGAKRPVFTRDYFFRKYESQYPPPGDDPVRKAIQMKEAEIQTLVNQIESIKKVSIEISLPSGATKEAAQREILEIDSRGDEYYTDLATKSFPIRLDYSPWLPSPSKRASKIREYANDLRALDERKREKELEILERPASSLSKKVPRWKPGSGARGLMDLYRSQMKRWDDLTPKLTALKMALALAKRPVVDLDGKVMPLSQEKKDLVRSIESDLDFYQGFDYSSAQIALSREQTTKYELTDFEDRTRVVLALPNGPAKTKALTKLQSQIRKKLTDVDLDLSDYDLKEIDAIHQKISSLRANIIDLESGRLSTRILMDFSKTSKPTETAIGTRLEVLKSKPRLATYRGQKVVVNTYVNLSSVSSGFEGTSTPSGPGQSPGPRSASSLRSEWLITLQGTPGEILTNSEEFQLDEFEANPYDQRLGIGSLTLIPSSKIFTPEVKKAIRKSKGKAKKTASVSKEPEVEIDPSPILAIVTGFDKTGVTAWPLLSATMKMVGSRIQSIRRRIAVKTKAGLTKERVALLQEYLEELVGDYELLRTRHSKTDIETQKRKIEELQKKINSTKEVGVPEKSTEEEEKTLKKLEAQQARLKALGQKSVKVSYSEIEKVNGPRIFVGGTRKSTVSFGDQAITPDIVLHYIQNYFLILKPVFSGGSDELRSLEAFQKKFQGILGKLLPDYFSSAASLRSVPERVWTVITKDLEGKVTEEEFETGGQKTSTKKKKSRTKEEKAEKEARNKKLVEIALEKKWIETINEHYETPAGRKTRDQVVSKLVEERMDEDSKKLPDEVLDDLIQGTMFGRDEYQVSTKTGKSKKIATVNQSIFEGVEVLSRDSARSLVKSISLVKGGFNVVQRFKMKLSSTLGTEEPMTVEELIRTSVNEEVRYIRGYPGPYGQGYSVAQRTIDQTKIFMEAQYSRYYSETDADVLKFQKKYTSDKVWLKSVLEKKKPPTESKETKVVEGTEGAEKVEELYPGDQWLVTEVTRALKTALASKDISTNSDLIAQMALCYLVFESVLAPKFKYVKQALRLRILPITSLPFGNGQLLAPELYLNSAVNDPAKFEGIRTNLLSLESEAFDKLERYLGQESGQKKTYAAKEYPYNIDDALVNLDKVCMESTGTGKRLLTFREVMERALKRKRGARGPAYPNRKFNEIFNLTEDIPDDDLLLDITDTGDFVCSSVREIVDAYYYGGGTSLPKKYIDMAKSLPKPKKPLETFARLTAKEKLDVDKAAAWILEEWHEKVEKLRNPVVEVASKASVPRDPDIGVRTSYGNTIVACPDLPKGLRGIMKVLVSGGAGVVSYLLTSDTKSPYDIFVKLASPSTVDKENPEKWKLASGKGKNVFVMMSTAPNGAKEEEKVAKFTDRIRRYFEVPEGEEDRKKYFEDPTRQKILRRATFDLPVLGQGVLGAEILRKVIPKTIQQTGYYVENQDFSAKISEFIRSNYGQELLNETSKVFHDFFGDQLRFSKAVIPKVANRFLEFTPDADLGPIDEVSIGDPEIVDYYLEGDTVRYFTDLVLKQIFGEPFLTPVNMDDIKKGVAAKDKDLTSTQIKLYRRVLNKYLYPIGPSQTQDSVTQFGGYVPSMEDVAVIGDRLLLQLRDISNNEDREKYLQSILDSDAYTLREALKPTKGKAQWVVMFEKIMRDEYGLRELFRKLGHQFPTTEDPKEIRKVVTKLTPVLKAGFHDAFSKTSKKTREKILEVLNSGEIKDLVDLVFGKDDLALRWKSSWKWLNEGVTKMHDNGLRFQLYRDLGWSKVKNPTEYEISSLFQKRFENLDEGHQRSLLGRVGKIGHTRTTIDSFIRELLGK